MEYGTNDDDSRASMTELLIAASVGLWFIGLSLGLSNSHAHWSLVSSFLYVRKSARVAVVGGIGRCGLIGTCCMTGVLAVSRTGVLVRSVQGYQINIPASMVPVEALHTEFGIRDIFLCGIRDIMLDIEKYEFLVLGILSLIPKMFSCY